MSSSLLSGVKAYVAEQGGGEGLFPTHIDGFNIVHSYQTRMPMRQVYRPSVCVVLQGGKELFFGDDILTYGPMECLVVSMELPGTGRIARASPDDPYIGITLDFDVAMLSEVMAQMGTTAPQSQSPGPCIFVDQVTEPLADCILRLLRLSRTPSAIPVLCPAIMREVCYWLLSGPKGGELSKLALPESNAKQVAKAISALHLNYTQVLRIEQLAEIAHMSPSSFYQHFKALTAMSPLQFQKQLRLLEARRVMVSEAANVSEAAYKVGYESVSQFSREYSRMFGIAPKQDVQNHRRVHAQYASRSVRSPESLQELG